MGTEEAIIYSYDLATVPSVIPAFANAKDVLICDEVRQSCHPEFPHADWKHSSETSWKQPQSLLARA